jgi:hypothetical protein
LHDRYWYDGRSYECRNENNKKHRTVKQNDRMAGIGMMEAAMNAARLQTVVVSTDTPDLRITSPTWS